MFEVGPWAEGEFHDHSLILHGFGPCLLTEYALEAEPGLVAWGKGAGQGPMIVDDYEAECEMVQEAELGLAVEPEHWKAV